MTPPEESLARRAAAQHASIAVKQPHSILVRAWLACQVELSGHYSVQRMLALDAYTRVATSRRISLFFAFSIVPCLLGVLLLESFPLAPIELGLGHARNFWIRSGIGTFMVTYPMVAQFHQGIPDLDLTPKRILCISLVTTACVQPVMYALAVHIGYPVPFFVITGICPWAMIVVTTTVFVLRRQLRRDAAIRAKVRKYWKISAAQTLLIVTYPTYTYVFNQLGSSSQTAFALLLPIIKLALKNVFSYASRHIEDLRPELIVFNVEIFSSLYVSACMQSATSILTTLLITGLDFAQGVLSIKDLNDVLDDPALWAALRSEDPMNGSVDSYTQRLIPLTMHILQTNRAIRNDPPIQLKTCGPKSDLVLKSAAQRLTQIVPGGRPPSNLHHSPLSQVTSKFRASVQALKINFSLDTALNARTQSVFLGVGSFYADFLNQRIEKDQQELARIASRLTDAQQLLVVQKTLRVLHIAEFIALIEYSEVFVPVVYCIFCVIAYTFSNRSYYAMISDLDTAAFLKTLSNVLLYGSLELISYVGLDYVMRQKFHLSAFAQTAFVLETQWAMVQPKLMLWMVVVLQFALIHYGNDFSFQFQWLHPKE